MSILQRFILILCVLLIWAWSVVAVVPPLASVSLAWDRAASHGPEITYVLKWGKSTNSESEDFYNNLINVGTGTTTTLVNLTTGYIYFHVVARTPEGLESDPSNVVSVTNYPAAPLQLRMTTNTTSSLKLEGLIAGEWKELATVVNDPVVIQQNTRSLLLRAKQVTPPPLP